MRLAITLLSLLAILAAPAAASTGCKLCCESEDGGVARGRESVCPCCGEHAKPESQPSQCESRCVCEYDFPRHAPRRADEGSSLAPTPEIRTGADGFRVPAIAVVEAGVNHTPPEVFTPLRV